MHVSSDDPASSSLSASSRWLVPVVLVTVVSPFATDAYLPAFPTLVVDLGLTPPLVQTTLTAFVIAFAAGQLIGGTLSDRHGPKTTIIASSLLFTVGSALCVLADGLAPFNAARALEGVGAGAAVAAARGVVADHSTGVVLARRLGLLFTALVLGADLRPESRFDCDLRLRLACGLRRSGGPGGGHDRACCGSGTSAQL